MFNSIVTKPTRAVREFGTVIRTSLWFVPLAPILPLFLVVAP